MCLQLLLPPSPPESPPQQPLYSHPPLPSPGLAVMQDLLGSFLHLPLPEPISPIYSNPIATSSS